MDNKMTLGQWVLTLLVSNIPCVGFVLLIIWAAGDGGGYSARKNFAVAYLIFKVVMYVISFLLSTFTSIGTYMMGNAPYGLLFF